MFAGPSWKEDIVTAERSLQFLGSFLSTFGTVKDDRQQKGVSGFVAERVPYTGPCASKRIER